MEKLKNTGRQVLNTLNPIRDDIPGPDKIINIIAIVFGARYMIWLTGKFWFIGALFSERWDFSVLLFLGPLIWIPAAVVLFYRRKKAGGIMFMVYAVCAAVSAAGTFIMALNKRPSAIPALDNLSPVTSPVVPFLIFAIFAVTAGILTRNDIRAVYSIGKQAAILTIVLTALTTVSGIFLLFAI